MGVGAGLDLTGLLLIQLGFENIFTVHFSHHKKKKWCIWFYANVFFLPILGLPV